MKPRRLVRCGFGGPGGFVAAGCLLIAACCIARDKVSK
jgi:hypothetical protein